MISTESSIPVSGFRSLWIGELENQFFPHLTYLNSGYIYSAYLKTALVGLIVLNVNLSMV